MIINAIIPNDILERSKNMAIGIYNGSKHRNRDYNQIYEDCVKGKSLELGFSIVNNLQFNPLTEDPANRLSYEYDLINTSTNETFEVKQGFIVNKGKYGKTLSFHRSIIDLLELRPNTNYVCFGKTNKLDQIYVGQNVELMANMELMAVIPRTCLLWYSKPSTVTKNYMYFQDGIAKSKFNFTLYFK